MADAAITIVSGLPRSGTSLMMQMLRAGGLELLADGIRQPDDDNPRGYFEFEPVKTIATDSAWLSRAEGKAVKIISLLLFDLPPGPHYRIIFMTRDLGEILASQRAMLLRRGGPDAGPADADMRRHFETHLAKVKRHLASLPYSKTFYCHYNDLLADPAAAVAAIAAFIGGTPDRPRMLAAVDPALYRIRNTTRSPSGP